MKIFNNFEDWPKPVEKKSLTKGPNVNKENEKNENHLKKNKNKKTDEAGTGLNDGERIKSRHVKRSTPVEFTPEQIREKVDISKNMKDVSKNMKSDRVSSSMPDIATKAIEIEEKFSDVNKNDPNDPATIGKLKDLLSKGGVEFSEKERQVISKIIEE